MQIGNDLSLFSTPESVELDIAYTNSSYPSTATDFLPDCNTTLVEKTACLKVCKITSSSVSTHIIGIEPLDSISVVLTPKIGNTINTNPAGIPKNLKQATDNIVEIPIQTQDVEFDSDYQLRTSSFHIKDNSNLSADVFYKIGICPLDGKYSYSDFTASPATPGVSLGGIQELLTEDELLLNKDTTYVHGLYYKLLKGTLATEKDSYNSGNYGFVSSLIIPLVNTDNQIIGFGYIKLYNQDGTEFTTNLRDKNIIICCRPSENADPEEVWMTAQAGLHLTITDQDLDSGYIHTEYTPSPFPTIGRYSNTLNPPETVSSGSSFDTGLEYDQDKLYIITTDDGSGNTTYYGWEPEEGNS